MVIANKTKLQKVFDDLYTDAASTLKHQNIKLQFQEDQSILSGSVKSLTFIMLDDTVTSEEKIAFKTKVAMSINMYLHLKDGGAVDMFNEAKAKYRKQRIKSVIDGLE